MALVLCARQVPELLFEQIKTNGNLLARLGSLVEINMEFLASESHVFRRVLFCKFQ